MQNDSRSVFPNGIRALIVDSDARFIRSASLMLSLLNFRVASCETPASAVKLLSGKLKHADVVFIDALSATTCGFDFRGIVEAQLCIPVVYFFSRDYGVHGEVADALQRTVRAATYVLRTPLDADDLCNLWRLIQWSKFLLRRGDESSPEWSHGNPALPAATVQALLPGSSSPAFQDQQAREDDYDDGHGHFQAVRARRGRPRRNLDDGHDGGGGSSSRGRGRGSGRGRGRGRGGIAGSFEIGGLTRGHEQMIVIEEEESDDDDMVPSHLQPAQQKRRLLQAMDVQNQQHGRSLFMQPSPEMLNMPRNNPMISPDAAGPSSSNATAFAGPSNTSAPRLLPLPVYQAPAQATSPAAELPPSVYQQKQQPVARYNFGKKIPPPPAGVPTMATNNGKQPQFTPNHHQKQDMFALRNQGVWMGRRRKTGITMLSFQQPPATDPFTLTFGASPTATDDADAGAAYVDAAMAVENSQSQNNVGAQPEPADSFDDDVFQGMDMDDEFTRSYYANCSPEELIAMAKGLAVAPGAMQAGLGSGNCSNYFNAGSSSMAMDVSGGSSSASFMAPQDLAVPNENHQVEDIYGSLVGPSQGPPISPMFNGDAGDMAAMFPSEQYHENAMFSPDALWNFDDDVQMYPEGQQAGAADGAAATNSAGIMSNGGESSAGLGPNSWNMGAADDDGVDIMEEYLMDDNETDFLFPQDRNNGHQ